MKVEWSNKDSLEMPTTTTSDCIKREDAIQALCRGEGCGNICRHNIERLPSADVVKVVRCKDCKHHEELLNNNDENVLCWVHDIDVIVDRNGYCSYGEQKEQDHE